MMDKYTARDWYNARAMFERDFLQAVLIEERGNVKAVAKRLTLDRGSLYRKMRKLGLIPDDVLAHAGVTRLLPRHTGNKMVSHAP